MYKSATWDNREKLTLGKCQVTAVLMDDGTVMSVHGADWTDFWPKMGPEARKKFQARVNRRLARSNRAA